MDKTSETMAPLANADFDGGPFFPADRAEMIMVDKITGARRPFNVTHSGATLRDWFAGQALAGWLGSWPENGEHPVKAAADLARSSYMIADAMIAARSARVEG